MIFFLPEVHLGYFDSKTAEFIIKKQANRSLYSKALYNFQKGQCLYMCIIYL